MCLLTYFLSLRTDDRKLSVLMDLFDSNKDGTINYSEFLFMFVDRRDILRRWQASVAAPAKEGAAAMAVSGTLSRALLRRTEFNAVPLIIHSRVVSKKSVREKDWRGRKCGTQAT